MIDKEEIEILDGFFNKGWCYDLDQIYNIVMRLKDRVEELESDNYEQNNIINNYIEIEKEHKKINGELQEKLTELEQENKRLTEIIEGKSIQELGMSDIYKED